jgi:4,4'-diaponeurosporenoate glycosyltransferase
VTPVLVLLLVVAAAVAVRHQLARPRAIVPEDSAPPPGPADPPRVSVVIPARNEGHALPRLLVSLTAAAPWLREVVVVDDSSTDDTAEAARVCGATVIAAPPPPDGWTGKARACHLGVEHSTGSLLLFLDADTTLAPGAVPALLEEHARLGGLLSVQPHHEPIEAYEQLSSYFNHVSLVACGAFTPHRARRPMAFGPCLLTTREDYLRAGGHAGVRSAILDDAELAAAYGRAGLPVTCTLGGDAVRMRMYPRGPRQLVEGWTKNIASGATQADPLSSAIGGAWVATHFAVVSGLLGLGVGLANGADPGSTALAWPAAYAVVAVEMRRHLRRTGTFRWWTWAVFPVPLLAFGLVFARSLVLTRVLRSVRWKGRAVALSPTGGTREEG